MREYLDFEKPIAEIEAKIEKLTAAGQGQPGVQDDLRKLREKLYKLQAEIYAGLTPWQRTQVARHPQRPSTLDYIGRICDSFLELHGDRLFGDDQAIVAGVAPPGRPAGVGLRAPKGKKPEKRGARHLRVPQPGRDRQAPPPMRPAPRIKQTGITLLHT